MTFSRRSVCVMLAGAAVSGCSGSGSTVGPIATGSPTPSPTPMPTPTPTVSRSVLGTLTADLFVDFDAVGGGDGRSRSTAFNTFAALQASPLFGDGKTVAVRGGATIRRAGIDVLVNNVRMIAYDGMVVLDGTDIAPNASFTPHATLSNCYTIDWNHDLQSGNSWPRVWFNGVPLKRQETEAAVAATPGTYTSGALDSIVVGQPVHIVAHFPGSVSPTAGNPIEIARRDFAISLGTGSVLHGFYGRRTGSHDGAFRMGNNARASRILAEEGTIHNWVFGDGTFDDIIAVNAADDEFGAGSILGTNYVDRSADGFSIIHNRPAFIVDGSVYGGQVSTGGVQGVGYYCHGVGSGTFDLLTINDAVVSGLATGMLVNAKLSRINAPLVERLTGINSTGISGPNVTVRGGLFLGVPRAVDATTIDVEGGVFLTVSRVSGAMFWQYPTGVDSLRLVNNYISESNGTIFLASNPSANITINRNIIDGPTIVYNLAALPASTNIDNNIYMALSGYSTSFYIADTKLSFAQWQGRGVDGNSLEANPGWAVGKPSPSQTNIRLSANNAATARGIVPIDQTDVDDILARPRTLAQAQDYLSNKAPYYAVA